MFEDSLNLIAKLPTIAATIYRRAFWGCRRRRHGAACGFVGAARRYLPGTAGLLPSHSLPYSLPFVLRFRRNTYKGGKLVEAHPQLDWAANLTHMMGALLCALCLL